MDISILCVYFVELSLSEHGLQKIPLGTAYAVWTGIGAVGTAVIGIFLFSEPSDFWRIFFIMLLIGSIIGLKLVSAH